MHLNRRVRLQLVFFAVMSLLAGGLIGFNYLGLPNLLFGIGHYRVTVLLPAAAGLYDDANVTYRGTEVGRVQALDLTDTGVAATLSLRSDVPIPVDLDAKVRSQTAVGEQFVELLPRSGQGPNLKEGDVIPAERTTVPPDISELLDATNRGLQAIPGDDLKVAIDEAYTAVGGLGPELSRIVKGTNRLASDARRQLDDLTNVVDHSGPLLQTQVDTSDEIQAWAASVAEITDQVRTEDQGVRGILAEAPGTATEIRQLIERVQPTLPVLLANLVSIGPVAVTYQPHIEQLLVLLPRGVEVLQGAGLANRNTKQDYKGINLSFKLNLNLPPACVTGYLPPQQQRSPGQTDYPDRPEGDVYCRIPQDAMNAVRGARNLPCVTRPGKRAPTVKMCESDIEYVPLNDGFAWKGDPNATLSGQAVPQPRDPSAADVVTPAVAPPLAVADYDPATGGYIGSDGQRYAQTDLAVGAGERTWQDLLVPQRGQ
ncbi:MlaD family protein [Mycobacterium sp. ACS4331]|uniref:MCE family protein n=1 Tax=Mycobacterium sp. ACS4331 TaxID=1834121 RepID=UPI00080039A8|nr:MlaD family protein [Mycobacterium sp. ACS4331]OBF29690.1 mammalian cell entry protein [Mycobacterium sp. ACS4331]